MSDLGPVQFEHQESSVFLGRDYNKSRNFSDQVALEIDEETRKIINECYGKSKKIISENMDLLKLIAETLIEHETLTQEQIEHLVEHGKMPEEETENEEKTIVELRILAKEKGIKGYTKMGKEELEKALEE